MGYRSPPETVELARTTMRHIREALTRDAAGRFPPAYAEVDWQGMNLPPPDTAWQDMDMGDRYDLLRHALDESIWGLEHPGRRGDATSDSRQLAAEFVREEQRALNAELRHDETLRRLEGRGVKYEDAAERPLDQAEARREPDPARRARFQPPDDPRNLAR